MIVPMQKVTVLCLPGDREDTLYTLRRLGVLHVVPVNAPEGREVEEAWHELERIHRALEHLRPTKNVELLDETPEALVRRIEDNVHRSKTLAEEIKHLDFELRRLAPFGDFDPETIRFLEAKGLSLQLYKAPAGTEFALPEGTARQTLHTEKKAEYGLVVGRAPCTLENAEILAPPEQSIPAMRERLEAIQLEQVALTEELDRLGAIRDTLKECMIVAEDNLALEETRAGMGHAEPICYLRGYCPPESVSAIRDEAPRHGWGVVIEEVPPGETVPTLIRNPAWVHPIKAIFDFIGVTPGYEEVDISALFLLFFSVFFAMIVGDAGYGVVYLGLTLFGMFKWPETPRYIFRLMLIMSVCTIAFGLMTGNIFGILPEAYPAVLVRFEVPWLHDADPAVTEHHLMLLCFLIGTIHLTLAHGWNIIRQFPNPIFLSQLGWICTSWVMYFVARHMVLNDAFPGIMTSVLIVGVILIATFMTPIKQLKTEWFNHVMLPLNLISNFVDIVSYVRLYAVGMATYSVASAFNEMGGAMFSGLIGSLLGALTIFFGHTLNLMLASMGVLVHGIRLNTLEFSNHLGLQWSGTPFKPFMQKATNNLKET